MRVLASSWLALALSADGFGVGVAYGIKKIKIPIGPLFLMCCCAMSAISISMLAGTTIARYFGPDLAKKLGAAALMVIGLWFASDYLRNKSIEEVDVVNPAIATLRIQSLGIIVQILREPVKADFDLSGSISFHEALFLGTALAVDGLGAGIGASMAGLNIYITTTCVGLCELILVNIGFQLGKRMNKPTFQKYASVLSGIVLFILGVYHW